jgi:nucleoside-diphosphate-sugar epimerase
MQVVILGCGAVGAAAGRLLLARGHHVTGVRRRPDGDPGFPLITGDAAENGLWPRLPRPDAVLLTATPGLRRGRDHGLDRAAALIPSGIRLIYSGTTAVYGDAGGATITEDGPLAPDAGPLLAVETAVLAHADALVLRCPALVGPSRTRIATRAAAAAAAGQPLVVAGDPDRPFSYLHDDDLAWLLAEAVDGRLAAVRGVLNAAHPRCHSVRAHYTAAAGIPIAVIGDGTAKPSRAIDAGRLHLLLTDRTWTTG